MPRLQAFLAVLAALPLLLSTASADGRIESFTLTSTSFEGNLIGVSPERNVRVYLPEGHGRGRQRFAVIYTLHDFFEQEGSIFDDHRFGDLMDEAIADGRMPPAIVVSADFSTPVANSLYTNSPVTGDWRTFMVEELVPEIDRRYQTLAKRESRGLLGYHIGGYGAIRFAARHPDVFGSVYALHPVATGIGYVVRVDRPNWQRLQETQSLEDLKGDFMAEIFTSIFQAHTPNPEKPPLFIDQYARMEDGELIFDTATSRRFYDSFFLEAEIPQYADALNSLVAFKFDWGRHDPNQDHVVANEYYSKKLRQFGVRHEAEEYQGGWGDKTWDEGGRVETDVFPFFTQHLATE